MTRRALLALGTAASAALIVAGISGLRGRSGLPAALTVDSDLLLASGVCLAACVAGAAEKGDESLPGA